METKEFRYGQHTYLCMDCTAIANIAGEDERQDALFVLVKDDSDCVDEYVVFGWSLSSLNSDEDFRYMVEQDGIAWDDYCDTCETVRVGEYTAHDITHDIFWGW